MTEATSSVAVVIPCHRVRRHILGVVKTIPDWVSSIYVVDDLCPEQTGSFVREQQSDPRVKIIFNEMNLGVGGAVMAGYAQAIRDGCQVLVKMDGDGQMDPEMLGVLIAPILKGEADYTKGNRFFDLGHIRRMPLARIIGNAALSFASKVSTGYWDIFDPTNGYTAVHARVAARLPLDRISRGYFFETDILFRLNTLRARVIDVPMDARYGDEISGLRVTKILGSFVSGHVTNTCKRIFYNYFLRDLSLASVELVAGTLLMLGGLATGISLWSASAAAGATTSAGGVMLAALPMLVGLQFLLGFIGYDIASVPDRSIHPLLSQTQPLQSPLRDKSN